MEILFICNILAFLGGRSCMIRDDHRSRCICEFSFRSDVHGPQVDASDWAHRKRQTLSCVPSLAGCWFYGIGIIWYINVCRKDKVRIKLYASKRTKFIMAHYSRIAWFSLTHDGHLLATTSSKDTLVRIFNTIDGTLRQEVYFYLIERCDLCGIVRLQLWLLEFFFLWIPFVFAPQIPKF